MGNKGGKENLIVPTSEQARINGRKGGLTRAENERKRKSMREALEMMMYDVELDEELKKRLIAQGVKDPKHFNHQMVITRSLIAKAEAGDVQAYNAICAMIGEKPAEKVEMSAEVSGEIRVVFVDDDEDGDDLPSSEDEVDAER